MDSVAEDLGQVPQERPYDGPDAPSPTPTGRAARRRQRERWKKTQRRALVATAVALVGGGMTVASVNRQAPDRTQAASAPDREVMGAAEEQVTDPTPVSSTPTDSYRARHASSPAADRFATTGTPREQAAAAPQARPKTQTQTRTVQQKNVTSPLTAVNSDVSAVASTVSDTTDTAAGTASTPAPAATDNTSTSTSTSTSGTDTATDTSSATPSPSDPPASSSSSASSPTGICLLGLVCIT
ncbi:hypothetical protein PV735_27670 [Streptomyces turgidiscabies]|nr:hypothetical protein [Streptomyces turgidiscabies]MDX3496441.1 hypothetical protein [Streptomyces turgidiscabies]